MAPTTAPHPATPLRLSWYLDASGRLTSRWVPCPVRQAEDAVAVHPQDTFSLAS